MPHPAPDSPSLRAEGGGALDVWALLGTHLGDNRSIEALVEAIGLPWRAIQLRFNPLGALPNLKAGGSLFTLRRGEAAKLAAPYPKLVVTSGKRAVPAALRIRRLSGGRTKLLHIGRPQAPLEFFDLIVTSPQYALPKRPNVATFRFPPAIIPKPAACPPDLAALAQPRLVAIIGGPTPPIVLDADVARAFARAAIERTAAAGGSLLVATSPRTPKAAVAALKEELAQGRVPVRLSVFGEGVNRYRDFLAAADRLLVTDETVSMAAEAAFTGASVELFRLPRRPSPGVRLALAAQRAALARPSGARVVEALAAAGLIRSNRDLDGYMRALEADGLLAGGPAARELAAAELAEAARRARVLIGIL